MSFTDLTEGVLQEFADVAHAGREWIDEYEGFRVIRRADPRIAARCYHNAHVAARDAVRCVDCGGLREPYQQQRCARCQEAHRKACHDAQKREAWRANRPLPTCADCGATCTRTNAKRCPPCASADRRKRLLARIARKRAEKRKAKNGGQS